MLSFSMIPSLTVVLVFCLDSFYLNVQTTGAVLFPLMLFFKLIILLIPRRGRVTASHAAVPGSIPGRLKCSKFIPGTESRRDGGVKPNP